MSLNNSIVTQSIGIPYQQYVTSSAGHTLVSSSTYFNDTSDNIPRYKDASGLIYDAIISSSYALTASHALNSGGGGSTFPFTGDAVITGSLKVSGSFLAFRLEEDNIILGAGTGTSIEAAASDNVILGNNTATSLTTGINNVLIGEDVGTTLTTEGYNVAIGHRALNENEGEQNVHIGTSAGRYGAAANYNVSVGYASLQGATGAQRTGDFNVALGYYSMIAATAGSKNVAIGQESGRNLQSGNNNILIGYRAGKEIYAGGDNIFIGYNLEGASGESNQLRIGPSTKIVISGSLTTGDLIFASTASAAYFVGDGSQLTNLPSGGSAFPFTGDAQITGSLVISASNNTSESLSIEGSGSTIFSIQGSQGQLFSVTDDLLDEVFSVADISGDTLLSVSGSGLVEIPVGDLTGSATATASYGTFKGDGSQLTNLPASDPFPYTGDAQITGSLIVSGSFNAFKLNSDNVILGDGAAANIPTGATKIVAIGYQAAGGGTITTAGDKNVAIGYQAGYDLTSGAYNVHVGHQAGYNNTSGQSNVAIGEAAGYGVSNGQNGVYIGQNTSVLGNGYGNIMIGVQAGRGASGGTPDYCVFLGQSAGYSAHDTDWDIAIGNNALYNINDGNNNIAIGRNAGYNITDGHNNIIIGSGSLGEAAMSNQLRIGNSNNLVTISASLATGDIIFASTASAAYFSGDGSQLTNLPASSTFPFTGDAQITGSLEVSGSYKVVSPTRGTMFNIDANTFTLGPGASAGGGYTAVAIGHNASTGNNYSVSIGSGATTNSYTYAVAIGGANVNANGTGAVSIGGNSCHAGAYGISMGYQALASGDYSINLGRSCRGTGANSINFDVSGDGIAVPSNTRAFNVFLSDGTGNPDFVISASNESKLSGSSFTIENSGSTVFDVIGSQGTLFAVDDDLSGTLFTANDISGLPVLEASASGEVYIGKSPQSLYTTAVISSTTAATTQSIFGLSTSSYDGAFFDYTVQSGSNARAGNIMTVWNGSNISYTETTTTDIGDTTDFNLIVHISQSQAQIASHATNAGYKIKTIIRSI